jgi:hypothetical protein
MQFLATADQINMAFARLLAKHDKVSFATAWASCDGPAYKGLFYNKAKIAQAVVGTHFYQTDPEFIEAFLHNKSFRFVKQTDGVFHPKLYLFYGGDAWNAIIGSANFTNGGFRRNLEVATLLGDADDPDGTVRRQIDTTLKQYWKFGDLFSPAELKAYRIIAARTRERLKRAAGQFGKGEKGTLPVQTKLITWSWPEFYRKVLKDREDGVETRLEVLGRARTLFQENRHFCDMPDPDRKGIAGFSTDPAIGWGWFGSMKGAGEFKKQINRNSVHISRALDHIPLKGPVRKEHYMAYIHHYLRAYPHGRDGQATATRLLAMKRPDTFICIDSKNREALVKSLKISLRNKDYENYWDAVIERIRESNWWNAPRPTTGQAAQVWDNRAAFLDSIFYVGYGPV